VTATENKVGAANSVVPLFPQLAFPNDAKLHLLPRLFDGDWVWQESQSHFTDMDKAPCQIRVRQFSHNPGKSAIVSYVADWAPDQYLASEFFSFRLEAGRAPAIARYPCDGFLPGLEKAACPDSALTLLNEHVFAFPRRKIRVDMVRYRPGSRAVLRHRSGKIKLYARVMRPSALPHLLNAAELIGHSEFAVPRIVGSWKEGGVVWLSEIPGQNVRKLMRRAKPPEPDAILDGLEGLWNAPCHSYCRAFNLRGAYNRAKRTFRHALRERDETRLVLDSVIRALDPFVRSWQPSAIAHNDLYDDQMLALPDGRVAIVDFEEAGPGDPLLDVGNFLAHLKWTSNIGRTRKHDVSGAYYHRLRTAALDRLKWNEHELNLREAVCLFRITTNTIRRPAQDWHERTLSSLNLISESLV